MVNRDEEEVLDRVDVDLDKYRKMHRSSSYRYSRGNQSDSSESGEVREDRSKHRSERRDKYSEQKEDGEIREDKDVRARGENNKDLTSGEGNDSRRHEREERRESGHRGHLRDGKSLGREKDGRLEDEGRRHNYSSENQSDSSEPGEVREDRYKHRSERRDKYREQKEDGEIRESKDSRARGEGDKDLADGDRDDSRRHEREERRESRHRSHHRDGKYSGIEKDGRLEDEGRRHGDSGRSKADVDGRNRYENGQRQRQAESSRDKDRYRGLREESGDDDGRDTEIRGIRERHSRRNVDPDDNGERKREREKQRDRERNGRDDDRHDRRPRSDYNDKSHKRRDERRDDQTHGRVRSTKEINEKEGDGKRLEDSKSQKPSTLQDGNPNGDTTNLGRSGGVYIPPFKLARMMRDVEDKSSVEYQRLTWDALRKSINGLVNKVNATNIKNIIPELFAENLVRGRGLFCRSCMKSQMASPGFTDVFAALVAVVNTKFPEVGDLLLRRIVLQLKRAYKRNDKPQLLAAVKFIAHLVNQQVAHEIIALELLTLLLENPTDDSVEVAVGFVTECGSLLQDLSPQGIHGIFERFRGILHEGEIDKRVQFLIEGLFAIRKAKFQGYPAVRPELDLVEQEDQLTHELSLDDEIDPQITLDIFKPDPNFLENEKRFEELKKNILGEESSEDEEGSDEGTDDEDDEESEEEQQEQMEINDETETNLINLRRTIYLTIMSSVDFEEAGHKLLKIKLEPGQEMELCIMLLECCSQERTYLRYYGLLGQRFCMINKIHQENFEKCFVQQYSMIHRLETNKLRNVAKFFAHLLGTDALPWHVLSYIRLTEEDTTSSSRIFIKILFQELSEHLGIRLLNERLSDPTMQESFESIFPKDNPKNTRFSINFFTSIGLGGITENLREYLKNMPRLIMQQQKAVSESESESDSGSASSSESDDSKSESASESESESESASSTDSESDRAKRRHKRRRRD